MGGHSHPVLISCLIICLFQIIKWTGGKECNSGVCCSNYYREDDQCKECPLGTHGINCNFSCPYNYFGRFCVELCNCPINQYCSPAAGCIQHRENVTDKDLFASNISAVYSATNRANSKQTSVWKITISAFLVTTVIGLSATGLISLKSRTQKIQLSSRFQFEEENHINSVAPRNTGVDLERDSYTVNGHAVPNKEENLDKIHDILRTSKILNTESISVTESIEQQLPYFDLEVDQETNNEQSLVCNYEQWHMPIQYSFLSLKVDINLPAADLYDPSELITDDVYDFMQFHEINEEITPTCSQSVSETCSHRSGSTDEDDTGVDN